MSVNDEKKFFISLFFLLFTIICITRQDVTSLRKHENILEDFQLQYMNNNLSCPGQI